MSLRIRIILLAAAAMVVGGAITAVVLWKLNELRETDPPIMSKTYIPPQFQDLRNSPGHTNHGQAKVECRNCHNMEGDEIRGPKIDVCVGCHTNISTEVHEARKNADKPGCLSCHIFTPGSFDPANACLKCHGENARFASLKPVGAHQSVRCLTCHKQHEAASPVPNGCPDCHEEKAAETGHGDQKLEGARQCLQCHQLHEGARYAPDRCATCHASAEGKTIVNAEKALFMEKGGRGHTVCVDCHKPHTFTKATVQPCVECHKDQKVLAEARVPAHRKCDSCHTPHDVKSAPVSCTSGGCHRGNVTDHPAPQNKCTSCHPPHPNQLVSAAAITTFKALECKQCHKEATEANPFHVSELACNDCHKPHKFSQKGKGAVLCRTCHTDKGAEVQPAAGHRDCLNCHAGAAHTPKLKPKECVACHTEQKRTAPSGHQDCKGCHVTHSGARKKEADCKKCHTEQAATRHGKKVDCVRCHQPHGPKGPARPPACASCHSVEKLPGLHSSPEHHKCTSCHSAHGKAPKADRATCTSCHKDKTGHEPSAKRCNGCHVFKQ